MTQFETLQINALEMLLEIFERQALSGVTPSKRSLLKVYLADLENYHFRYQSAENMRFFEMFDVLQKRNSGLLEFKANDPDCLQWEHDMRNSKKMKGKVSSPAYEITVTKSFPAHARKWINNIKIGATIKPEQVHIYWEPTEFRVSRTDSEGFKPYRIRRGQGGTDKRRIVVSELFKHHPTKTAVKEILKMTELNLEGIKDHVSKVNATIGTKLNVTGRNLISHNEDWTELFLNQKDFYFEA